jgi:hypothetical protein
MADTGDMILPMLREMRPESAQRHAEVLARLDKLEQAQVSFKHALTADSLLGKLVTGGFEERLSILEGKFRELERSK